MEAVLNYLRNYFYKFGEYGAHSIAYNKITVRGTYLVGQYIKVVGSMSDGIYQVLKVEADTITVAGELSNEDFTGTVFSLNVPREIRKVAEQIQEFNRQLSVSGFESESFGDYSYTRAKNQNGELLGWKDVFKTELAPYKKIYDNVRGVAMI